MDSFLPDCENDCIKMIIKLSLTYNGIIIRSEIMEKTKEFKTPHTYLIIFGIVIVAWILTFLIPAGKFTTEEMTYNGSDGSTLTRQVLIHDSFRYMHPLNQQKLTESLSELQTNDAKLIEFEVNKDDLKTLMSSGEEISLEILEGIGLEE